MVTGTGRIVGMEALVRWDHPRRGLVSPMDFIPVAETTGAIGPLGRWVLESACHQMVAWQQRHPHAPPLYVSVNVSTSQLRDAGLVAQVERLLAQSRLPPDSLR